MRGYVGLKKDAARAEGGGSFSSREDESWSKIEKEVEVEGDEVI